MESNNSTTAARMTLAEKAKREMIRYLTISSYLYVCFGALILYKAAILHAEGLPFAAFGLAGAKALILGKFMLLAETFKFGERAKFDRVAAQILAKSLMFALLLIVLSFIEEVIVALIHGEKAKDVAAIFAGGTLPQLLASTLLMVMIMVPYFAFGEISASMGKGKLVRLLTEISPRENAGG